MKDFKESEPSTVKIRLKELSDRLKVLQDEHEQIENNREYDDYFTIRVSDIPTREDEIFGECLELTQAIADLNSNQ